MEGKETIANLNIGIFYFSNRCSNSYILASRDEKIMELHKRVFIETVKGNEKTLGPKFKQVLYIVSHKFLFPRAVGNPTACRNSLARCSVQGRALRTQRSALALPRRWRNALGANQVGLSTVGFSETQLNPPPLFFFSLS